MKQSIAHAKEERETVFAYVQAHPGQTGEDIAYNNIRIGHPRTVRALAQLRRLGRVLKDGNRQAARFFVA